MTQPQNPIQLLAQLLQGGGQMTQQGPDLGALLKQMKVQRDPQGFYNKMNTMPSAGGGSPWNDISGRGALFKPMAEAFARPTTGGAPPSGGFWGGVGQAVTDPFRQIIKNPAQPKKTAPAPGRGAFVY